MLWGGEFSGIGGGGIVSVQVGEVVGLGGGWVHVGCVQVWGGGGVFRYGGFKVGRGCSGGLGGLKGSKGANNIWGELIDFLLFEFRYRNGLGRTIALQSFRNNSLDKCKNSCKVLHDARNTIKIEKIHFNVIFYSLNNPL